MEGILFAIFWLTGSLLAHGFHFASERNNACLRSSYWDDFRIIAFLSLMCSWIGLFVVLSLHWKPKHGFRLW
jgi:hypothetical protein